MSNARGCDAASGPPEDRFPRPPRVPARPAARWSLLRRLKAELAAEMHSLWGPRSPNGWGILSYHRVFPLAGCREEPTWNVAPEQLERQLQGLLAMGYTPWPLSRVVAQVEAGQSPPPKTFVVTFDDGYANNLTHAFPVFARLGVPLTIFLPTAYLGSGGPLPFDDWRLAGDASVPRDAWRALTWDECRQLQATGLVEFGAHTHTHADYRGQPADFASDLDCCLRTLERELQIARPSFAFPYGTKHNGFVTPELIAIAQRLGVRCCLTTEATVICREQSPFDWGRFEATPDDTARTLAAKLSGWLTRWGVFSTPDFPPPQPKTACRSTALRAVGREAAKDDLRASSDSLAGDSTPPGELATAARAITSATESQP